MTLDCKHKIHGKFFFGDDTEKRIHGELTYNSESISEIEFNDSITQDFENTLEPIYGETNKGKITLFKAFLRSTNTDFNSDNIRQKLSVPICVCGDHVKDFEGFEVKTLKIQCFGLGDIFIGNGFKCDGVGTTSPTIKFTPSELARLKTPFGEMELVKNVSWKTAMGKEGYGESEVYLSEKNYAIYHFTKNTKYAKAIAEVNHFLLLLTILTNTVIHPIKILAKRGSDKRWLTILTKAEYPFEKVNSYGRRYLNIQDIDLSLICRKWYALDKKLSTTLHLRKFRINDQIRFSFSENRYLDAITALETFHRKIYGGEPSVDPYITQTIDSIWESKIIPEDQKKFFIEKFKPRNQKTLIERLRELHEGLPVDIQNKLTDNLDKYLIGLRDTRNAFTHNSARNKKTVFRSNLMIRATKNCEIVLDYLTLRLLEVDQFHLDKRFQSLYELKQLEYG